MDLFLPQKDQLSRLIQEKAEELLKKLQDLPVEQLGMPDYCLAYFKGSHFKRLFFSIETSAHLLYNSISLSKKPVQEIVLMDYGAGVGTLYTLAKMIGCNKVIYNDHLSDWKLSAQLIAEAIGVNVAVATDSQSIGFALPINTVKGVIASVQATGKIVRPYVGVRYIQVTTALVKNEKLAASYGVLVKSDGASSPAVVKGSPAEKAGIKEGDIITHFDGKKIDETKSFAIMVREHKVGDTITLKLLRGGVEKTIQVVLEEAPQS